MNRIKYKEAAGLEVRRGRPSASPAPSKKELVRLYIKERRSIRDVAIALNCSKDSIHRALKQHGIKARTGAGRKSALLQYSLTDLKAAVQEKGIRRYARELGIDEGTLRHHLKVRSGK